MREGGAIEVPRPLQSLDHEVELGVVIGKEGRDIALEDAMDHVSGIDVNAVELSVAIDQLETGEYSLDIVAL